MKTMNFTKKEKMIIFLVMASFAFVCNFAFTKWENANANPTLHNIESAAEYFDVAEAELTLFPYKVGGNQFNAYAIETKSGVQVALPDFEQRKGDPWKWEWLRNRPDLEEVVLKSIKEKK